MTAAADVHAICASAAAASNEGAEFELRVPRRASDELRTLT
jgi:hypothetical protein